jgi:hypothetical protein
MAEHHLTLPCALTSHTLTSLTRTTARCLPGGAAPGQGGGGPELPEDIGRQGAMMLLQEIYKGACYLQCA